MAETKKRVIIVDDEPGILRFLHIKLKLAGYDVVTTTSGEEALHLVKSQNPDIMLLDIFMHPVTGFEVLERLRRFSSMPVIIMTARRDVAEEALKQGANGYITKPFIPEELVKEIQVFLDKRNSET